MNLEIDLERVVLAHKAVRAELLAERNAAGYWEGRLAGSPLATATAVSALVAAHHADTGTTLRESLLGDGQVIEQLVQCDLSEFLVESVRWLARHQNPDGGWGDCEGAKSNIAATLLVQAAFRVTGVPAKYADLMLHADQHVAREGGIAAVWQRYANEKLLVAPILANCALAGMVGWRQVPTLPFERLALPERWRQRVQLPFARQDTAALIAVGHAKFHHDPPRNPLMRLLRRSVRGRSLAMLEHFQAADESFLASTAITSFIVMSLASSGCRDHPIVQRGVEFLLSLVRGDASWPIAANLAVTNTTLALQSLANDHVVGSMNLSPLHAQHAGSAISAQRRSELNAIPWDEVTASDARRLEDDNPESIERVAAVGADDHEAPFNERCLDWLLACQRTEPNPLTGVAAGGWAASDVRGALPNATDTARALEAISHWPRLSSPLRRERAERAIRLGVAWLLDLQNDDGGWPTYYRDSGALRLEESGTDVTAHVLRALAIWQHEWRRHSDAAELAPRTEAAIVRGWNFLQSQQRDDGSFIPLWFGNEHQPANQNPVYGTSQALMSCAALQRLETETALRAARWLVSAQHSGGGWGLPRAPLDYSATAKDGFRAWRANEAMAKLCSVEETALAITGLLPLAERGEGFARAISSGLGWLAAAIEQDAHRRPAVIGFSLSKIWYHERLYPLVFAAGALSRAERQLALQAREAAAAVSHR